jgi:hypothetical protein
MCSFFCLFFKTLILFLHQFGGFLCSLITKRSVVEGIPKQSLGTRKKKVQRGALWNAFPNRVWEREKAFPNRVWEREKAFPNRVWEREKNIQA